jgi:hypothetical protein
MPFLIPIRTTITYLNHTESEVEWAHWSSQRGADLPKKPKGEDHHPRVNAKIQDNQSTQ